MKYLLTIYIDESRYATMTPDDSARLMAGYGAFGQEAQEAGVLLGGEGLQPTATATTVRVRDGEALFTDGPFAETREQLGGYYLLECKDLDEAIEWAARIPGAKNGTIEVRPIMEFSEDGTPKTGAEAGAQA
jgi:hypothetical protein